MKCLRSCIIAFNKKFLFGYPGGFISQVCVALCAHTHIGHPKKNIQYLRILVVVCVCLEMHVYCFVDMWLCLVLKQELL